jgi:HK97 family phage major capsid protein
MKRILDLRSDITAKETRMAAIFSACEKENRSRNAEETTEWQKLKGEVDSLKVELKDLEEQEQRNRAAATNLPPATHETPGKTDVGIDEIKNIRKAQLGKAVRSANPKSGVKLEGVEKELHDEGVKECRATGVPITDGATLIPYMALRNLSWRPDIERRDITSAAGLGAELINTQTLPDRYIEALRAQNVLMNAGIEFIPNTTGDNQNWPRENSLYTAAMAATENAAATETMTASLFTTLSFTPKRGTGFVQLSNQVGSIQAPWIEQRLRNQILKGNATLMDTQGISGSGSSGQVTGILNTSSVGTVVGGTNGANFARTHITQFESTVGAAGANLANCSYITNFAVNAYGKRTEFSSGSGRYLIESAPMWTWDPTATGKGAVSLIDQYRAFLSANVPSNLTKGTASGICSAVMFGDVTQAKYMQFGGLQVIVDPYSQGQSALTNYYVHFWFDFKVILPGAWAISQDMLTP